MVGTTSTSASTSTSARVVIVILLLLLLLMSLGAFPTWVRAPTVLHLSAAPKLAPRYHG